MEIYEKNLKILAERYPQMDVLIENAQEGWKPKLTITEEVSRDGETILKIEKDNVVCYLGGKRDAAEPARMWVDSLGELPRSTPIFLMGIGNHLYLQRLVERVEKPLSIIVYEPSLEIFLNFLRRVHLQKWMEKHLIVFWVEGLDGMDTEHMKGALSGLLRYELLPYVCRLILPNYETLFAENAVEFIRVCRDIVVKEVMTFNTRKLFSNVMVKNLLSNARYLCDGYQTTQLTDVIPGDIPGILVAAGPSLNKNVAELKKAKGRALIIAVDTAIKPLLRAGVVPDLFFIIDAVKPVELVQMEEAREIPVVTTLNAASEVLEYHRGMKIFFNEGYLFSERIIARGGKRYGDVSSGGSVATSAFSLFYKLGLSRIILVGQDLAYTNNCSHADGTFQEIMEEQDTKNFIKVEGNYEKEVPTAADLKVFLDWYDMYIEGCREHTENFRVINATEGGAKIKNTEIMTLRDAVEQECTTEVDIQKCLGRLEPMLNAEAREWAVSYLKGLPGDFEKLLAHAKKLKGLYGKLDKICNKRKLDEKEYLSILKRLEKEIKRTEALDVYQLAAITLDNARVILQNEQFLEEDTIQEEGKEIARKGLLYMDNVAKCAELFREYAQEIYGDAFH